MKRFYLIWLGISIIACGNAQSKKTIIVKAGTSIAEGVPIAEIFQYPQFSNGTIYFRTGDVSEAKLNYNIFLDEMQFIDGKGDTLALANEVTVKVIVVNSDSFYYDKGYIRLLNGNSLLRLAVKQGVRVLDKRKESAYGASTSVSSIRNLNAYSNGRRLYQVAVTEDVVLAKEEYYYFGDQYNHYVIATKKSLLELLPKHSEVITKYLKENDTKFYKKADLEKLLEFLAHL